MDVIMEKYEAFIGSVKNHKEELKKDMVEVTQGDLGADAMDYMKLVMEHISWIDLNVLAAERRMRKLKRN